MVDLTVVLTAKNPDDVPRLRELLIKQANFSLQEPGCLRFEAYESTSVANTFVLVERWQDQAALDAHRLAEGFLTVYQPLVIPLVDRTAHVGRSLLTADT